VVRLLTLEEMERTHVEHALRAMRGHRGRTAQVLGISERSLYRMLLKHGLAG
jgi:two-component system response regulator AtoC